MEKKHWKIIAITFMILFGLLVLFNLWSVGLVLEEEEKTYECYYEVCEDYPYAEYQDKVCSCYDYDLLGELIVEKEKYMK